MVDNFSKIRELLKFDSDDDFYICQILQRRKENPEINKGAKIKKVYYIHSLEDYDKCIDSIKENCHHYNARAYINLNKRSVEKVGLTVLKLTADYLYNKQYKSIQNVYETACGKTGSTEYWIIDVDEMEEYPKIMNYIENNSIICITTIPTVNGCHIIVKPFNLKEFKEIFKEDYIHKNNPTVLYYKST